MINPIEYDKLRGNCIFIDVRSPKEYNSAHIPNAINIPILDDEERAEVGTLYKQVSVETATRRGVEIGSSKLLSIYDQVLKIKQESDHQRIVFYCSRGGYRSKSVALFLSGIGVSVYLIRGGYKGYRNYVLSQLPILNERVTYVVLHGHTGTGKTHLLTNLDKQGENVLDFEEGANHRGSLLGHIGLANGQSAKHFESYIYHKLDTIVNNNKDDENIYVFVEAESRRIGKIFIPDFIHAKMQTGIHVNINCPIEIRGKNLIEDYISNENFEAEFLATFEKLSRYLSKDKLNTYNALLTKKDYQAIAEDLMLNYYDPMYLNSTKVTKYEREFDNLDHSECAKEIAEWYHENYHVISDELEEDL